MIEIKKMDENLIERANSNSFGGTCGNLENASYLSCAEKICGWDISEAKKQKLLDELYKKYTELMSLSARHISIMVTGKLDYSAKILELSSNLFDWFKDIDEQR